MFIIQILIEKNFFLYIRNLYDGNSHRIFQRKKKDEKSKSADFLLTSELLDIERLLNYLKIL